MTHDDSGGDGSTTLSSLGIGWVTDLKELTDYVDELIAFASSPLQYIRLRVIIPAVITLIEVTTGRVRWLWGIIADAVEASGDSVEFAFGASGDVLLDAVAIFPNLVESMSGELGPIAGPTVVGIGGALLLWVAWQAIKRAPGTFWTLYQAIPGT